MDKMIEPGYYYNGENHKRFFDERDIEALFFKNRILYQKEDFTGKYGDEKYLWEVVVTKSN